MSPRDAGWQRSAIGAAIGIAAALPLAAWMWGFTIDDALISVRYARHLADGAGYRFNAGGPVTDGVTPLPWPFLLAPLAHADAMTVLVRAKCLGLGAWLGAAGALGAAVARAEGAAWVKAAAAIVLALSVPVAAHAVSGMETGIALALATCAAIASRPRAAAVLAGLAAAFRPEMAAWALVLAVLRAPRDARRVTERAILAAIALAPFAACAIARVLVFGRPAPLAVMAKPSDIEHGAAYAIVAVVVTLAPIAACAPIALRRARGPAVAIALAGVAHVGALVAVGGDWMPHARLMAPIAPSLVFAFVLAAPHARAWSNALRGAIAIVASLALFHIVPSGRNVGSDRASLVAAARPELANASRVAALDVGWVSAATEAPLVDLAGVTDPTIAALGGGHTSKRVDPVMLLDTGADALLLYSPVAIDLASWTTARYPRVVEARLARSELIAERFTARAWLPLGATGAGYVLLSRDKR